MMVAGPSAQFPHLHSARGIPTATEVSMASHHVTVTDRSPSNLPDCLAEFVVFAEHLRQSGFFDVIDDALPIDRGRGYLACDVIAFLVAFFSSGSQGLRPFYEKNRRHGSLLAALVDRRQWPSSAAISRACSAISLDQAQRFSNWILCHGADFSHLLEHSEVTLRDRLSRRWHVLDFDPSVEVFRQRALPLGNDLPEPKRRYSNLARPGYSGRKRGEVQLSRAILQHAGTGQYIFSSLSPGNGHSRQALCSALDTARIWARSNRQSEELILVRLDGGVGGHVPAITACLQAGVCYIARHGFYSLLDQPDVFRRLQSGAWHDVSDSGSGPQRQALELGQMVLRADNETRHEDGSPFSPVPTRMVVSRYRVSTDEQGESLKCGVGREIDGWVYEIFVTDMVDEALDAADVVMLYYGRSVIENRFAQEDRELKLGRVFHTDLAGQSVIQAVGLMVWNLRTALGAALVEASEYRSMPILTPRQNQNVDLHQLPIPVEKNQRKPRARRSGVRARFQGVIGLVGALSKRLFLPHRPNWSWRHDQGLVCPNGEVLYPYVLEESACQSKLKVRFRAGLKVCRSCPIRSTCTTSRKMTFRKETEWTLQRKDDPQAYQSLLDAHDKSQPKPVKLEPAPRPALPEKIHRLSKGPDSVRQPQVNPSYFRRSWLEAMADIRVSVDLWQPDDDAETAPWLVLTPAQRQRRRLTWTQRKKRNQLPNKAQVSVGYETSSTSARWITSMLSQKLVTSGAYTVT